MVVQSDLDVIVKSSRDEVFVFAENMLTGKPWSGVRLLISNGREVIGEGTTDAHGVFRKDYRDFMSSTSGGPAETAPPANVPQSEPAPAVQPQPVPQAPSPLTPPAPAPSASNAPAAGSASLASSPALPSDDGSSNEPPPASPFAPGDDAVQAPPLVAKPQAIGLPQGVAVPQEVAPPQAVPQGVVMPQAPVSQQPAVERRGVPLTATDIRVFAVIDNNVASNMLNLQGVGVAQGLTDKGYIYTDRPAYRAGQLVNIRGCLRRAANDAYVIDKDKPYTVEVFDARNRPIRQEKVKLNAFGSFHAHFVLPPNSPQGQYRVLVHDNAAQNFQGTFLVHEYQLEPIRLVVDTRAPGTPGRRVYYRGEPIEGTIRAEFYYGAPVVGREIRYQLADDRLQTATTDAKGEVHINLPTRDYSESQILPLAVQLPEGNIAVQINFVLAAQGFSIGVSTLRPVYVTGESLEATLNVRDAENKPLAQKLTLKVLERTMVEGRPGERLVEEFQLTTAADGKVRQTIKLDKGGVYFLRAEAIDRFHNPITGQAAVQISGEEDLVRLRILADRHTYKVGDTAAVQLHWRDPPALALVTYQGARVLDYRLVELQTGANRLEIPMTASLAPNFELAVAVMTDPRGGLGGGGGGKGGKGDVGRDKGAAVDAHHARTDNSAASAGPPDTAIPLAKKNKIESGNKLPHSKLRFHTATSPFIVERDLHVKIATKRKSPHPLPLSRVRERGDGVRPGDELEVTVTTTDPQGKPVAAELSLAMVEQSLLERFAAPLPSIGDFFRGAPREPAVRCTSSITFSYRPATQPINPRLLAEKDREEIAKEEAESRSAALAITRTTADGAVLSFGTAVPDGGIVSNGGMMYGLGVNSDSGLVGDITIDEADIPGTEDSLLTYPDPQQWSDLSGRRSTSGGTKGMKFNRQRSLNQRLSRGAQQANGQSQEWHLGMEGQLPIGYSQGLNLNMEFTESDSGLVAQDMREKGFSVGNRFLPVKQGAGVLTLNGGNTTRAAPISRPATSTAWSRRTRNRSSWSITRACTAASA